jgi:hypothetical protein
MKIDFPRNIGFTLLAVYLILVAIISLAPGVAIPNIVLGVIALVSGIFILLGR